jgi:hypothetical protein
LLVQQSHQPEILDAFSDRLVVQPRTRKTRQPALPLDTQLTLFVIDPSAPLS